ncbi:hypothetical protein HK096_005623, partial [Nowakowskiella sp. JEL0078]
MPNKVNENNVEIQKCPRGDRVLVSKRAFSAGDIIIKERALLSSVFDPQVPSNITSINVLPHDFHLLTLKYCQLRASSASNDSLDLLLSLSTDGVTSDIAKATDPERVNDYNAAAKSIVYKWKGITLNISFLSLFLKFGPAKQKKKKNCSKYTITVSEIERLIQIIETNCHSSTSTSPGNSELCGVFYLASMMDHSCYQNSNVTLSTDGNSIELVLTATREILAGELVTINYQDNDFQPTRIRRSGLLKRGFFCCCVLCDSALVGRIKDLSRSAVCQNVDCHGIVTPFGEGSKPEDWVCNICKKSTSSTQFDAIILKEATLTPNAGSNSKVEEIFAKLFFDLVSDLRKSWDILPVPPSLSKITTKADKLMFPLTSYHWLLYGTLKSTVFDNPTFTQVFGADAAFLAMYYLVSVNSWVTNGRCTFYREETKHHLTWLKSLLVKQN